MTPADNTLLSDRIRGILIEELQWDGSPEELADDVPLIEDHILDSLGLLRLVTRLESEFGITIRDEDAVIANFGSIARIAAYVQGAIGAP